MANVESHPVANSPAPQKGFFGRMGNKYTNFQKKRMNANAEKAQAYRTKQANLKAHINSKNFLKKFAQNQNIQTLVEASNMQNIDKIINSAYKSIVKRTTDQHGFNRSKSNSKERVNAINDLLRRIGNSNAPILNPKTQGMFSRFGSSVSSGASAALKTASKITTIGNKVVGLNARQQKLLNGYKKIFGNKNFGNLEYKTKTNNTPINKFLNNLGIEKAKKYNRTGQPITKYNRFLLELERQFLLANGEIPNLANPIKNNKRTLENLRKTKPVMGTPVKINIGVSNKPVNGTPVKINIGVSNKPVNGTPVKPANMGTFNSHLKGINSTLKNRNQARSIVNIIIKKLKNGQL